MAGERNDAIDSIKCIAILFVVYIHSVSVRNNALGEPADFLFFLDTFGRFAVPFFFMVSGYWVGKKTGINPRSPAYYKKYIGRIAALLVRWALLYYLYDAAAAILSGHPDRIVALTRSFLGYRTLYYGTPGTSYQLWYLIASLWSVAILYAFIRMGRLKLLLAGSLLLNLAGLFGQSYSVFAKFPLSVTRDGLFYGLFYTTLGYAFSQYYPQIQMKLTRVPDSFYLIMSGVFAGLQMLERTLLFAPEHLRSSENYFLSTIPSAVCLFLFVLSKPDFGKNSLLSKIGQRAVGIYVIHLLFLDLTQRLLAYLHEEAVYAFVLWHLLAAPALMAVSYFAYAGLQRAKHLMQWKKPDAAITGKQALS